MLLMNSPVDVYSWTPGGPRRQAGLRRIARQLEAKARYLEELCTMSFPHKARWMSHRRGSRRPLYLVDFGLAFASILASVSILFEPIYRSLSTHQFATLTKGGPGILSIPSAQLVN